MTGRHPNRFGCFKWGHTLRPQEITGFEMENQPPLDGISLVPLLDRQMEIRPKPMGFWDYPVRGEQKPGSTWMRDLLESQQSGKDSDDPARLHPDAGNMSKRYP